MSKMTRREIYDYALSAYRAMEGKNPEHLPYEGASDAPFFGIDPELVAKLCYRDEVKKLTREFEKGQIAGKDATSLFSPVVATKGTCKGFKGLVVQIAPNAHDGRSACLVYDLFGIHSEWFAESALKVRPYLPGERDLMHSITKADEDRDIYLTSGVNVSLKGDPGMVGFTTNKATPKFSDANFAYEVRVQWEGNAPSHHILYELEVIS